MEAGEKFEMSFKLDINTADKEMVKLFEEEWINLEKTLDLENQSSEFQQNMFQSNLTESSLQFLNKLGILSNIKLSLDAFKTMTFGKENPVQERRNFNLRVQDEEELFDTFLSSILEMAKTCQFCTQCEESLIRDRIVAGISDLLTISKLLDEADLNLQKTIEICRAEEAQRFKIAEPLIKLEPADIDDTFFDDPSLDVDEELLDGPLYQPKKPKLKMRVRIRAKMKKPRAKENRMTLKVSGDSEGLDVNPDLEDDDKDLICHKCTFVGKSKEMQRHIRNGHRKRKRPLPEDRSKFPCPQCTSSFSKNCLLKKHVQSVHERQVVALCSECPQTFLHQKGLALHMKTVHLNIKPHVCDVCHRKFSQAHHLTRHKMTHDKNYPFHCDLCGKAYARKQDLILHFDKHTDFKCSLCAEALESLKDLRIHRQNSHGLEIPNACDICQEGFVDRCFLTAHKIEIHQSSDPPCRCHSCKQIGKRVPLQTGKGKRKKNAIGEKNHPCHLCDKKFSVQIYLKNHLSSQHGLSNLPCKCDACLENPETGPLDKNHKHRPYRCDFCKQSFTSAMTLKNHSDLVHTSEKKFQCDLCPSQFKRPQQHKLHYQSVHLGMKPYTCTQCDAKFSQTTHLQKHVSAIHEGQKNFVCEFCDRKYANKPDLKNHLKRVHQKHVQYECSVCDFKHDKREPLLTHILEVHKKPQN